MPKITLRAYLEGIEELIDAGKNDEAIANCRHILKSFPKNIATYRLLGKSLLEEKRFGDASDIFQRVLSSAPDDFISHVGMSIIREDEGNTDTAISHMERAFESKPSNRAVQDELKRLYGQREGFTPPKVRLTRVALARMYSHGDLYNQAISELRIAIREDGPRPEILVLLAEMYAKTEQFDEALKISADILEKLPYCLYANHLSADIISKNKDPQAAKEYLVKVKDLDPYQVFTPPGVDPKDVAAEEVLLERLNINVDELVVQDTPLSWKGELESQDDGDNQFDSEDLPDWLSVPPEEEDQEEAEIPMTTSDLNALMEFATDLPARDEEVPASAQEIPAEEQQKTEDLKSENSEPVVPLGPPEDSEVDSVELPNDINEGLDSDESLAWLEGLAENQGAKEEELLSDPQSRKEINPDWSPNNEENKSNVEKRSLTWWLDELENSKDLEAEGLNPQDIISPGSQEEFTIPEESTDVNEVDQISPDAGEAGEPNIDLESSNDDKDLDTPDWLKDLADEAGAGTLSSLRSSQEALDNPPDWLDEFRASAKETAEESSSESANLSDHSNFQKETENDKGLTEENDLEGMKPKEDESLEPEKENLDDITEIINLGRESSSDWVPEKTVREEQIHPAKVPNLAENSEKLKDENKVSAESDPSNPLEKKISVNNKSSDSAEKKLEQARQALNFDKFEDAIQHYASILRSKQYIDEVIADLQAALMRHPKNVALWQLLGDAFMRGDHLREALDSYTKAEDLL